MSKKGQVGKPSSYLFYSEDDKYIADFFTSLGYVDLWSDTEAWIVVASKLSDRKGFKVNWLDVRNHWSVVDNLLEKMYNVTLVTREDFGMQADTTNFDKFRIFTYRLEEAKDQMRERSTKKRKTPETYKIMEPPVFPLLFASRNEGSSCLQKEGVYLPKQIFKGRRFYLLDTKDTFTGLTSRLSLEYLIRLHGGHVLERLEDMKRATCIAGRNEKLNQKLCGEIHDNLYLPSLVYQHVDDEKAMSSESQMDHVWLGIIESNDAMLAVSDDGEECEAPCANTLDVPESIEKRSSSEAADQMETEQRNVNQMEFEKQIEIRKVPSPAGIAREHTSRTIAQDVHVSSFIEQRQHTKIPVSDEAKANAGHSSKMLTVDEHIEKPMGSYIKDPLPLDEEPYYIDLPDVDETTENSMVLKASASVEGETSKAEGVGNEQMTSLKWALFFRLACYAKSKRNLCYLVTLEFLKETGERFNLFTARTFEQTMRKQASTIYAEIANQHKLNESMLVAFIKLENKK